MRFVGFEANEWLHNEDRLIAFIGGAQIDPYGNVNSTCIYGKGDYVKPQTRFTRFRRRQRHRHLLQHHHHDAAPEAPLYGEDRLHHLLRWMDGPGGREKVGLPGNRVPRWWSPTWAS